VDPLSGEDYAAWYRRYQIDWLKVMADDVGVGLPGDDEALALAREAARYVTYNCRSAFADAVPAIQALADSGLTLHTASGEDSCELAGYLTSMGVRGLFTHLFGPDLIDTFKRGARYYERAFASAGADPALCMVVDDSVEALGWAAEAGAQTVLVSRGRRVPGGYDGYAIQDLASLLPVVERLGGA
jgi:FMN phosphatase YigB (HAD superfamily)